MYCLLLLIRRKGRRRSVDDVKTRTNVEVKTFAKTYVEVIKQSVAPCGALLLPDLAGPELGECVLVLQHGSALPHPMDARPDEPLPPVPQP